MTGTQEARPTRQGPSESDDDTAGSFGNWFLRAKHLSNCPLHRLGDRLSLRPPALHHAGNSCCLIAVLRLRRMVRHGQEGVVRCAWGRCHGEWEMRSEHRSVADSTLDPGALTDELQQRPFLLQLPQAVAVALIQSGERRQVAPGEVVLRHGEVNQDLFLVGSGTLEVVEGDGGDTNLRLTTIPRGECFGELSILTHLPVSNTVRAISDCQLIAVPRDRFYELLERYASLGTLLNRILAIRLRASNQKLEQILQPGIWGNLEAFPFLSVVQSVQAASMTGTLSITRARGHALFGFQRGQLCFGEVDGIRGEDSLLSIFRWTNGIFRFQNQDLERIPNIHGETMSVLLDALRRFDELVLAERLQGTDTAMVEASATDIAPLVEEPTTKVSDATSLPPLSSTRVAESAIEPASTLSTIEISARDLDLHDSSVGSPPGDDPTDEFRIEDMDPPPYRP